jgi:hypothetical protein
MTIHWKAIEEHILMVPFLFRLFFRGNAFSEFFSTNASPYSVKRQSTDITTPARQPLIGHDKNTKREKKKPIN